MNLRDLIGIQLDMMGVLYTLTKLDVEMHHHTASRLLTATFESKTRTFDLSNNAIPEYRFAVTIGIDDATIAAVRSSYEWVHVVLQKLKIEIEHMSHEAPATFGPIPFPNDLRYTAMTRAEPLKVEEAKPKFRVRKPRFETES